MKRSSCLLYFFLITTTWCAAQMPLNEQEYADSLETILQQKDQDTSKARTNFLLADYWSSKNTVKAKQYLKRGHQLSGRYPYFNAVYYYYLANLVSKNDPDRGETGFMKADTLFSKFNTKEASLFRARAWRSYAVLRQRKDDYKVMADVLINKAVPFAQISGDSVFVGKNYLTLAIIFKNNNQFEKAETYCQAAIQMYKIAHAPPDQLLQAYHTAAENFVLGGKLPKAKPMLDSAMILLAPYPESEYLLDYYAAESMYFTVSEKYDSSLKSLDKGIVLARKIKKDYEEQRLLLQKFYALFNQKSFDKAKCVMLDLSKQKQMMSLAGNRLQVYYGLSETYANLGDMPKAFKWLKSYSQLNDSVNQSRLNNYIYELEIKYKNSENQKEIVTLKSRNEKAGLSAKNSRLAAWLLGTVSAFLFIAAVFGLLYYRNSRKLSAQKELNYQQHLKEIQQQQQLQISRAMLQGEEQERERLARDLHDGLGGMLAATKMGLSGFADSLSPRTKVNELDKLIEQLDNSASELRRIARNMMPEALLRMGLETALNDLCESLMSKTVSIDFQPFDIERTIPQQTQITIYRIVQELLANAIRHANASDIVLQCSQNNDTFFITAEDNGKGFDIQSKNSSNGIGLTNIKNRVDYLNGTLEIISSLNEGTSINIELHVA